MIDDYDGLAVVDPEGDRIGTVERSYVDERGAAHFLEVKLRGLRAKHRLVPAGEVERTEEALTVPFGRDVIEGSPDVRSAGNTLDSTILDDVRAYYDRQEAGNGDSEEQGPAPEATAASTPGAGAAAVPVSNVETDRSAGGADEGLGDRIKSAVERVRDKLPGGGAREDDEGDVGGAEAGRVRDLGDVVEIPVVEERVVKQPVVKEVLRVRKRQVSEEQTVRDEVRKEDVEVTRDGETEA